MGIFACLEGIDACGKTSTANKVIEMLKEKKVNAVLVEKKQTNYPSKYISNFMSSFGDLLWNYKIDDPVKEIPNEGWLYMHALWYTVMAEHYIEPFTKTYDIVLLDSWYYKILCRYLCKQNFDRDLLAKVFSNLPDADAVFLLDTSPEECWQRRSDFKLSEIGGYDKSVTNPKNGFIEYQSLVRQKYLDISQKPNWNVINSSEMSIETVCEEIVEKLLA